MRFSRIYFFAVLIIIGLFIQACEDSKDLENYCPVYEEDLLFYGGITETDENGLRIGSVDVGDWLQIEEDQNKQSISSMERPIFISHFSAEYSSGKVLIFWTTEWEVEDFLFWDIWRTEDENLNNAEMINESIIPACGDTLGPTDYYSFDESITVNKIYDYYIELTHADSTHEIWGPAQVLIPYLTYGPAYPNPIEDQAIIPILLSEEKDVELYVINETGDILDVLVDEELGAGIHNILWNASDKEDGLYRVIFHCKNDTLHHYGDILVEQ